MAIEKQMYLGTLTSLVESIWNIICYVVYVVKLYAIGAFALLLQLIENSAPVRGLPGQTGRTAIVTGGASGIGLHISRQLACLGAQVIIACRSKEEAQNAMEQIQEECPYAKVMFMELDLASFTSVRTFATAFQAKGLPLHILINNAGVMLVPHQETEDGHEYHLQVNHLSHALLTSLLKDSMEASAHSNAASRVINVSSIVHHVASLDCETFAEKQKDDWSYSPHNAYAVSKLAILLYTYALSQHWSKKDSKVTVNIIHPGVVNTDLYRHVHWIIAWSMDILRHFFFMSPERAALSVLHVATSPELEGVSGCYFSNRQQSGSSTASQMSSLQEAIFLRTQQVIEKKLQ